MKKKLQLLIITVWITAMLSGCSALFYDTYYSEKDFQGNQSIDLDSDVQMVHNYAELRRLVFNMMNNHEESTALRFAGYTGNPVSDLASVCNAVKTESSYGAYCVDYISYDMTQIVSYYEASITISYKYTAEEVELLKTTNNHDSFCAILAEELAAETPKIVVRVNNGVSEVSTVTELVEQTIRDNPLSLSYYPQFSVSIFSGNTSQKIYEVMIEYDEALDNQNRIKQMNDSIGSLTASLGDNDTKKALNAAQSLNEYCVYDKYAGNTAYDALVNQTADSEGISSAFKALCDKMGIECQIVNGRINREAHFWNILKINDQYYHFDISALRDHSGNQALFQNDEQRQVQAWWDQSVYPDCDGDITYFAAIAS